MERESNSMQALCRSGCGYFGNPSTDGFCSLCYKEAFKKKQALPNPGTSHNSSSSTETESSVASRSGEAEAGEKAEALSGPSPAQPSSPSISTPPPDKQEGKDTKKKKNLCATCRKKVGLTGFECRCGGLYCAIHRYSDKHDCTFNYRELGAQEIRRNNMVVISEKVPKI